MIIDKDFLKSVDPSVPFYSTGDKTSFAYKSALERWPVIITQVIDDLFRTIGESNSDEKDKEAEGKRIIEAIAKLKYEETHDRALVPLESDGQPDIQQYNDELNTLHNPTWFSVPWLFSECFLYRRLRILFTRSQYWTNYDPFHRSKDATFRSSGAAVEELAVRHEELLQDLSEKTYAEMKDDARKLLFMEMAQVSLWGNATDLSLLVNLSYEDLQKLQGKEAIANSQKNILTNDIEAAWDVISHTRKGRIDIVLDNAGFELFADLVFAMYLIETGHAETIVLHPKDHFWFVSDVTPRDIAHLFSCLQNSEYFPDVKDKGAIASMTSRWYIFFLISWSRSL